MMTVLVIVWWLYVGWLIARQIKRRRVLRGTSGRMFELDAIRVERAAGRKRK